MLVKDLLAEGTLHKTIDLLEGMLDATNPKKRRNDIMVRAYVVGAYYRKRPRNSYLKLVKPNKKLEHQADKLLKKGA